MDKYLQFDALELSEEPSFKRWAMQTTLDGDFNWDQWISAHPEKSDIMREARFMVTGLSFKSETIDPKSKDRVWSRIENQTKDARIRPLNSKRRFLHYISYGAAACLVAVLMYTNFFQSSLDTTIATTIAKVEKIQLPDGSIANLNAESELKYDKSSWSKDRRIELKGEAFFNVKKGSSFTVHTENGIVSVLGTSFNVLSRNKQLNVVCETGKVKVSGNGENTILTPNQSVIVDRNGHKLNNNIDENENRGHWRNGVYVYKNHPLKLVIEDIQRQFGYTFKINADLNRQITGSFNANNKENALSEVFWPLNMTYTIQNNVVTLSED